MLKIAYVLKISCMWIEVYRLLSWNPAVMNVLWQATASLKQVTLNNQEGSLQLNNNGMHKTTLQHQVLSHTFDSSLCACEMRNQSRKYILMTTKSILCGVEVPSLQNSLPEIWAPRLVFVIAWEEGQVAVWAIECSILVVPWVIEVDGLAGVFCVLSMIEADMPVGGCVAHVSISSSRLSYQW